MGRLYFFYMLCFVIIIGNVGNAQIISIAPGTDFNIVAGTVVAADGLDITPSTNFSLNASLSITTTINNTAAFPYIPRVYQFGQTTNAFSGTLKINYLDSELVGLGFTESTLKILYHNGSWAINNSSSNVASANSTLSGSLSAIALNEVISGICLTSSSSIAMKLSNQTTLAKLLSPTLHTWSILSGVDSGDFSLSLSGNPQQLLFNTVADNANPIDANLDNEYLVNITNGCETKNLAITISPFCGNWEQGYDGLTQAKAGISAAQIKSDYPNSQDGVYWINLPNVGLTQIYCIMNSAYDGGGWMLAMKASAGTTFNYDSNYWTTNNTLNPSDNTRNDGDAKYETMNDFEAKDMMAIWPDIASSSFESGSIDSLQNWTWLQNNFHNGAYIIPINFFNTVSNVFISDADTFDGKGAMFSGQSDVRFYGFNYSGNSYSRSRWGFGWNENGGGLFPNGDQGSNDVSGGIGMDSNYGNYSAGDRINCCENSGGINRQARVELYIR